MILKALAFVLSFFLSVSAAFAAPAISNVSGQASHKGVITISGSGFGTKSPAPPLWWDDGEGATVDNKTVLMTAPINHVVSSKAASSRVYRDAMPYNLTARPTANIAYRTAPYRSVPSPHSNSAKYIAGGHDSQGECLGGEPGQDVLLTVSNGTTTNSWYAHYYYRLDPLWPATSLNGANYKEGWWNPTTNSCSFGNNANYDAVVSCGGGVYGDNRRHPGCNDSWLAYSGIGALNYATCVGAINETRSWVNPKNAWVAMEKRLITSANYYRAYSDNVLGVSSALVGGCTATGPWCSLTVGGFWREGFCGNSQDDLNDNAFRYLDDIYIDTTLSRVMLCDNATYSSAKVCEPQIPSTWTSNSVSSTVNLGKLSGNVAYLFVFDAGDNHNSAGYPITISGGGGGETPPSAPTGLRIE